LGADLFYDFPLDALVLVAVLLRVVQKRLERGPVLLDPRFETGKRFDQDFAPIVAANL
jgi:hypothetical protein